MSEQNEGAEVDGAGGVRVDRPVRPPVKVVFVALLDSDGDRDGEGGWQVTVNGQIIIDRTKDTDIAWVGYEDLWDALGISVEFDYD